MACYHPLTAYQSIAKNSAGKSSITFTANGNSLPIQLPCGQCVGCRLERSRQWAIRCYHEASLYADNCFITLTYDEQHLPADGSIDVREFQLFMKKLRKKYPKKKFVTFIAGNTVLSSVGPTITLAYLTLTSGINVRLKLPTMYQYLYLKNLKKSGEKVSVLLDRLPSNRLLMSLDIS